MAVGAYCTYLPEPDLDAAVARLRTEAVAETATGVHRPGDGTAAVVTQQSCRVTEATLLARHLLERASDEPRPESAELLGLVTTAMGAPGTTLPPSLSHVDVATSAIPVCDDADAFDTEPVLLTVDLDLTDIETLNTLHLRPPSAIRFRLDSGARLDWVVRDATGDEWRTVTDAGDLPELPDDAEFVVYRTDPVTGAFAVQPASSYSDALRLAELFAEHGFPSAAEQAHGFGNPYPEVVKVAAVRRADDGGIAVIASGFAESRREFVAAQEARYVVNVVRAERAEPTRTGWLLFGLTVLTEGG